MSRGYIHTNVLLSYVLTEDINVKMIVESQKTEISKFEIITSTFGFWEMMCCLTEDEIKENAGKIRKIFRKIKIIPSEWDTKEPYKMSNERIKKLRKDSGVV